MLRPLYYLRAIFFALFVIVHTFLCSILVISALLLRFPRKVVDFLIGGVWCRPMLWISGIKPVIFGEENLPKDKGFLYLFTHSSHMDIPVLFAISPRSFRFGSKASLFKIPIFGQAIRLAGTLPITREDRAKVMEVYKEAETRVANGEAFALAPEGTRRVTEEIMPFKSGPFIFAINAKMPIVPVVFCGIDKALPKKSIFPNTDKFSREVGVQYLPAIETKDIPLEDMKKLKAQVRDQVVATYEEMKPRFYK